jgi:hypothetical protein
VGHDAGMGRWEKREAIVVPRIDRRHAEPSLPGWVECLLTERGRLCGGRGSLVR